jgi:hypothetical protein
MNADKTRFNPWRNDDHYKVAHSHPKVFREYLSREPAPSDELFKDAVRDGLIKESIQVWMGITP